MEKAKQGSYKIEYVVSYVRTHGEIYPRLIYISSVSRTPFKLIERDIWQQGHQRGSQARNLIYSNLRSC
jgi:hypothetical protein